MIPLFFTLSYFNSHAHVERDWGTGEQISGAPHFNSHAHVERDILIFSIFSLFSIFQLTRSRGA